MTPHERGQLSRNAAEFYDSHFVPSLFQPWAPHVVDAAQITAFDSVLDVACGTGVVANEVHRRIGSAVSVVGLDCNEDMLAVARRNEAITWTKGTAERLPFADQHFDAVVCQFGLMFFSGQINAISEMWRVLKPRGRLVVAVWDCLKNQPGHLALFEFLSAQLGMDASRSLLPPFSLGDQVQLKHLFGAANVTGVNISDCAAKARFSSIEQWLDAEINGWTLAGSLNAEALRLLQRNGKCRLGAFALPNGTVEFSTQALIVTAVKPL